MDYTFCINNGSFTATHPETAYNLFNASISEVLKLHSKDATHFRIIYDSTAESSYLSIALSDTYRIRDFLSDLATRGYRDRCELLLEMFDKSPAIASLSTEEFDELASAGFYFEEDGYTKSNDTLAIAWFFEAILLSLNTAERWSKSEIRFAKFVETGVVETFSLPNISALGHATELNKHDVDESLDALAPLLPKCVFSPAFSEWYATLDLANQRRLAAKLKLAHERDFNGGTPLFDTLSNADGMRELRVPFFPGGAMRVLFGSVTGGKFGILAGFVKKADNEGYKTNIAKATSAWKVM
jgi:hypothetical protein